LTDTKREQPASSLVTPYNWRKERFHFVPIGAVPPATGPCKHCGTPSKLADMSDSAVWRLMTGPSGEVVVVPLIAKSA